MALKQALRRRLKPAVDRVREWRDTLLSLRDPLGDVDAQAADRLRVLLVDEMLPDPRFGAGYPRAAQLVRSLVAAGADVTMYPLSASAGQYGAVQARFPSGVRFLVSRGRPGLRRLLQAGTGRFDLALVSRASTMAAFTAACASAPRFRPATVCIYDAEAISATLEVQRLALFGKASTGIDVERQLAAEIAIAADADAVVAVAPAVADIFRERVRIPVHTISHGVDLQPTATPLAQRSDLLIVGRFTGPREQSPNVDSIVWFVDEVMPVLDTLLGNGWRLVVAGLASDDLVRRLASDRVVFKGVVDDVASLYAECRLFVAPTRFSAAGLPLKVIEAAASGIPCVVTKLLARSLGFADGQQVLAADDAREFAARCHELYTRDATWHSVRDSALRSVTALYSLEAFDASVRALLADRVTPRRPPSR